MYVHGLLLSEGVNKIPIYAVNILKKQFVFSLTLNILPDLVDTNKNHNVPKKCE